MPYCTYCKEDYPAGTEECPSCHHLLQPRRPVYRPYDPDEPLVELCTAQGELEAELLKGQLEEKGIPIVFQRESVGRVMGLTVDGFGAERLLVPESLLHKARWSLVSLRRRGSWPRRRGRPATKRPARGRSAPV